MPQEYDHLLDLDKEVLVKSYRETLAYVIRLETHEKQLHQKIANMRRDFRRALQHLERTP